MRIGTIGTGFIVHYMIKNMQKVEGITCEAVYSRKKETGRALAGEFCIEKVYIDLDEMLQDDRIDFIYIASPNSLHYEQAKMALSYGKNVICEKPFTPTLVEAEELVRIAKEKHLFLFEAITTRYHPNYRWVKEHMADIGELKSMNCTFCQYSSRYDALKRGEVTNIFNPKFAGGALMDINVYNIHFVAGLLGAPDCVQYFAGTHENGVDLHGTLVMQYGDVICQCTGAKDSRCENSAQILGDKGYMHITPCSSICQEVRLVIGGEEQQRVRLEEHQLYYEMQELERLVREQDYDSCYKYLDETLVVVDILEKARKSAGLKF